MPKAIRKTRISTGHYAFDYKGHRVELIDLALFGDAGWIAPRDGDNSQEALPTMADAMRQAIRSIDAEA